MTEKRPYRTWPTETVTFTILSKLAKPIRKPRQAPTPWGAQALIRKVKFAYESSAPSPARADGSAGYGPKRHYRSADCFVECCASAISLLFPLWPLPVGTIHLTIGLFRAPNWC